MAWLWSLLWAASLGTAQAPPGRAIAPASWDQQGTGVNPPEWFGPVTTQAGLNTYTWRGSVRPPAGQAKLAVTFVFREPADGFARLIWQGQGRAVTVCQNLFERAATLHQRTLVLDQDTLGGPGFLVVTSTGTEPVIERAELAWVEPLVLAAGWAAPAGLYLTPSGKILPAEEIHGDGRRLPEDMAKGLVMDAILDAGPVHLDPQNPVRFLAPIDGDPAYARVEAQVAGMALGEEPVLWINGQALVGLAVEVASLDDPGYRLPVQATDLAYGGWRTVTAFVPMGVLRRGQNQLDWQTSSQSQGMTVRNLRLQVVFAKANRKPVLATVPPAPPATAVASVKTQPAPVVVSQTWVAQRPRLRTGLSSGAGAVGLRPE